MFIDASQFDFITRLESNYSLIRDEYLSLSSNAFDPWVQREMYSEGWSTFGIYADDHIVQSATTKCPYTVALINQVPGLVLAGFSQMAAGTHIAPHVGWAKSVYRLHLGLVVPDNCSLRVGAETRYWEEGKCLVFDDTVEHEAWNQSDSVRCNLLLDFLRPGIEQPDDCIPEEVRRYKKSLMDKD